MALSGATEENNKKAINNGTKSVYDYQKNTTKGCDADSRLLHFNQIHTKIKEKTECGIIPTATYTETHILDCLTDPINNLNVAKESINTLSTEITSLKSINSNCNNNTTGCTTDLTNCDTDLTNSQGQVDTLITDLTGCTGEITTFLTGYIIMGLSGADLTTALTEITTLNNDLTDCTTDLGSKTTDLTNCTSEITTFLTNSSAMLSTATDLTTALAEITTLDTNFNNCTDNLLALQGTNLADCTTDLTTAQDEIISTREAIHDIYGLYNLDPNNEYLDLITYNNNTNTNKIHLFNSDFVIDILYWSFDDNNYTDCFDIIDDTISPGVDFDTDCVWSYTYLYNTINGTDLYNDDDLSNDVFNDDNNQLLNNCIGSNFDINDDILLDNLTDDYPAFADCMYTDHITTTAP